MTDLDSSLNDLRFSAPIAGEGKGVMSSPRSGIMPTGGHSVPVMICSMITRGRDEGDASRSEYSEWAARSVPNYDVLSSMGWCTESNVDILVT